MKTWILMILMAFFSQHVHAAIEDSEQVELSDNEAAQIEEQTSVPRLRVFREFRRAKLRTPVRAIMQDVERDLSSNDKGLTASRLDQTVDAIVKRTTAVMEERGYKVEADEIRMEYYAKFKNYLTAMTLNKAADLGDLAPFSDFLTRVHAKAEDLLGETLCKFLHVHDIYIINYALPVVFAPSEHDLESFQNHFTGKHILGPLWEYYGLAPVVAYWAVNVTCIAGTWGMGIVGFVCSPIASVAENVFGIYLSPRLGEFVWKRAQ